MPLNIIIGAQWGDEGKGHITDLLAEEASVVARFSGGDNAGHTITVGDDIFKLHLIPSGVIHGNAICLIGNGTVVNPATMLREMEALDKRGIDVSAERLKLSRNAHLITPAHIALDKAKELVRGDGKIGTTLRGIGPAYTDKASRNGIRAGEMADPEQFADAIKAHVEHHNKTLTGVYGLEALDPSAVAAEYAAFAQKLAPHLADGGQIVDEELLAGNVVLAEGAQGTLLDIDHGTYPFVTSSAPTAGGALTGLGVGPKVVGLVVGVAKAFTSRVGSGPFPTELDGPDAVRLRGTGDKPWDEYGTTTGRPRRVGWLDLVILHHARRVNSVTEFVVSKLDILSGIEEIPVCVGYELDGQRITYFPPELPTVARCKPIYEVLPGWEEDIMGVRTMADLPANARRYVEFIADQVNVPVSYISVGPGRSQFIEVK